MPRGWEGGLCFRWTAMSVEWINWWYKCFSLSSLKECESQNHRIVQVGRDLKRSSTPTLHGKGSLDEVIFHPVQLHLKNLQRSGFYHIPCDVVPVNNCSHCNKISFLCWDETSTGATGTCCPLSSPCGFLWREGLHPLCSHPLSTGIPWWGLSEPSLPQGEKTPTPPVFPHRAGCPVLWSSLWPSFGPSPVCLHFTWIVREPELDTVLQV